jgi:hypothetical protein
MLLENPLLATPPGKVALALAPPPPTLIVNGVPTETELNVPDNKPPAPPPPPTK